MSKPLTDEQKARKAEWQRRKRARINSARPMLACRCGAEFRQERTKKWCTPSCEARHREARRREAAAARRKPCAICGAVISRGATRDRYCSEKCRLVKKHERLVTRYNKELSGGQLRAAAVAGLITRTAEKILYKNAPAEKHARALFRQSKNYHRKRAEQLAAAQPQRCPQCREEFISLDPRKKYCCRACGDKYQGRQWYAANRDRVRSYGLLRYYADLERSRQIARHRAALGRARNRAAKQEQRTPSTGAASC